MNFPAHLVKHVGRCFRCNDEVVWLKLEAKGKGKPVAIDLCLPGEGDVALILSLLTGVAPTVVPASGTKWRLHEPACLKREQAATLKRAPRAHSAYDRRNRRLCFLLDKLALGYSVTGGRR